MKLFQVAENRQIHMQAIAALAFLLKATRQALYEGIGHANISPLSPLPWNPTAHHQTTIL
ncbi:hypothetical protein [Marinobacterium sedimentorum]|uniref:hypothetical protein n=1 Tax=Marinobacterium sedimentorum TaxID=2927804 RepID=UPI0020C69D0B|nr:hypothetical protein [Marinobacterium sedimentorum]MCP8689450.1 hypothetical protein [Marinobacterium sedimentorum]